MTLQMWATLAILVVAIILFITEWLRVDMVALGVVILLMLTHVLTVEEALAGFSSSAVLTIASLFMVGGAVFQTGLAGMIATRVLKIAGQDEVRLTTAIMIAVAVLSGFMSDTGVVAVMLPAIISLAGSARISPSKLLIPLAFGSLLGGASTLIGTPPNIIVTDLLREEGLEPFKFFSFTPMGILLIITGVTFMILIGRRLLPDYRSSRDAQPVETPEELINLYRLPDSLFRLRVRKASRLVGQTLAASQLGHDYDIAVLEICRPVQPRTVARLGDQRLVVQSDSSTHIRPAPDVVLQVDDVLIVKGELNDVSKAAAQWKLAIQPASIVDRQALVTHELGIVEVVLPPRSSLIGKTLSELHFGSTYRLTVLDIRRSGVSGKLNLKETPLSFGDILLIQGEWKDILALNKRRRDFVVMGETEMMSNLPNPRKAAVAALILIGMLTLIVTGLVSVTAASMLAGLAVVLAGCLTMDEAYESIDWKSLVLIAGMLPMSTALVKVGLVSAIANGFVDTLGDFGPLAIMAGLFLLTSLFTQVLSNTATAVLVAPIALATAGRLGVDPYAFLMAVAIAASMAFASPVASPVNTLVIGAGSYSFRDYAKVGFPMIAVTMVVVLIALPILWPF